MQSISIRTNRSLQIWCALGLLLLGIAVRLPHLNQSLWYDEMATLADYVLGPWSKILAAGAGDYIPNNHVFHTILAKIVYTIGAGDDSIPPREALLRLPALVCGLLVPFALAWPMRHSCPLLALGVAVVTMLHPWLVDFSAEARGYSLLLLLGIIATNCLTTRPIGYAIALSLAIYTVPLAVFLVPAHAIAVFVLHRSAFRKWVIAAGVALALAVLLYLPMYRGLVSYYRNPFEPTMNYRQFLDSLPRHAFAGMRLPQNPDPLSRMKDPAAAAVFWTLPVVAIIIGSVLGWSRTAMRPLLLTLGITTILGVLFPLVLHNATEVRFVLWIMPWFCIAVVAILFAGPNRLARIAGVVGFASLISWQLTQDYTMPANQPIREGMVLADRMVPWDRYIMVLYLGARETIAVYGSQAGHHNLLPAPDVHFMLASERMALKDTGHLPWVVISFEQLACGRDAKAPEPHALWINLMLHYHLAGPRLPGRLTSVAIYAPNQD